VEKRLPSRGLKRKKRLGGEKADEGEAFTLEREGCKGKRFDHNWGINTKKKGWTSVFSKELKRFKV